METSGWAQNSWSTTLWPPHQPIRRKSAHSEDKEDFDPLPNWLSSINFPFLPLKIFLVELNLWNWVRGQDSAFSPGCLLNNANCPFQLILVSQILVFQQQAAAPKFGNKCKGSIDYWRTWAEVPNFTGRAVEGSPKEMMYTKVCRKDAIALTGPFIHFRPLEAERALCCQILFKYFLRFSTYFC